MMMVVTVMAMDLHPHSTYIAALAVVKEILLPRRAPVTDFVLHGWRAQNGTVLQRAFPAVAGCLVLCLCLSTPALCQNRSGAPASSVHIPPPDARIDINRATVDELLKVHGMTMPWAQRIVRFRPYRTKRDLLDSGVVSAEVYDRIKDDIIAHREKQ